METQVIKQKLDGLLEGIEKWPPEVKAVLMGVVSMVESLSAEILLLQRLNQKLQDEINRLKGEQGKPDIKGKGRGKGSDTDGNSDHSSEEERGKVGKVERKPKNRKRQTVKVTRTKIVDFGADQLPADAVFKGYESRVFQGLKIEIDNVELKLAVYYSPSQKKTYRAPLPAGYNGEFAPNIKALVVLLHRESHMTESAIRQFLMTYGVQISSSTISRMLTDGHEIFHKEKVDIMKAGLAVIPYQQLDDTGAKVNGNNCYTHILCSPYHSVYSTQPSKDRVTVLKVLYPDELKFALNLDALDLMRQAGLKDKWLPVMSPLMNGQIVTEVEMQGILAQLFPDPKKQITNRKIITEAAALTYYQQSEWAIKCLVSDDAPQFKSIAPKHALCWVHEGRHYKKLVPLAKRNRIILEDFRGKLWAFYHDLLAYTQAPTKEWAAKLNACFDALFATVTGYGDLDDCIVRTKGRKEGLLVCLENTYLPLHNNTSELGARVQARIRDIHLHTRNEKGTKAKDTFTTIVQTAKKLRVNIYDYLYDRITQKFEMRALADLLRAIVVNTTPLNTS